MTAQRKLKIFAETTADNGNRSLERSVNEWLETQARDSSFMVLQRECAVSQHGNYATLTVFIWYAINA